MRACAGKDAANSHNSALVRTSALAAKHACWYPQAHGPLVHTSCNFACECTHNDTIGISQGACVLCARRTAAATEALKPACWPPQRGAACPHPTSAARLICEGQRSLAQGRIRSAATATGAHSQSRLDRSLQARAWRFTSLECICSSAATLHIGQSKQASMHACR